MLIAINVIVIPRRGPGRVHDSPVDGRLDGCLSTAGSPRRTSATSHEYWRLVTSGFLHVEHPAHRLEHVRALLGRAPARAGDRPHPVPRHLLHGTARRVARGAHRLAAEPDGRSLGRDLRADGRRVHRGAPARHRSGAKPAGDPHRDQPGHHASAFRGSPSARISAAWSGVGSRRSPSSRATAGAHRGSATARVSRSPWSRWWRRSSWPTTRRWPRRNTVC